MPEVSSEQIRTWIDEDTVESVETHPDPSAEFNFTINMSNLLIHVIRREPGGPILLGQEIEYGEEIQERIQAMVKGDRDELVTRIREALMETPVIYGFRNAEGENVVFRELSHILVEYRIYPDGLTQQTLMSGLIDVWKAIRFLDDIVSLMNAAEN